MISAGDLAARAAGAGKVFREVASGAKTDRAQLRKAIAALESGDVLMVTRLDRLVRSTRDLLNTLAAIIGSKAGFRSLGAPRDCCRGADPLHHHQLTVPVHIEGRGAAGGRHQ
jgi:DNA invertase Pin-like site-specific DNA recombinase